MENLEQEKQIKTVDIYPCKRGRRVLAYLADFFFCFIAAVFLFEVVVRPSAFAIIDADKAFKTMQKNEKNNMYLLYDNDILYFDSNVSNIDYNKREELDLEDAIKETCSIFTCELIKTPDSLKHDVFTQYLINIKHQNIDDLLTAYNEKGTKYFDVNFEDKNVNLKTEYVELFAPKFEEGNELSKEGKKEYKKYEENFFLNFYSSLILKDIKKNDLSLESHPEYGTYLGNIKENNKLNDLINNTGEISAVIVFSIVMGCYYILVPLLNNKGRTACEMILKIERVDLKTVGYLSKGFVFSEALINILENTPMLCFIPIISFGFTSIITFPSLSSVGLIGLVFVIIQLFLMLFTKFNQSLKELATHSICVDTATMDEYYREKGYDF